MPQVPRLGLFALSLELDATLTCTNRSQSRPRGTTRRGDCNIVGIVCVCQAFNVTSDRKKGIEALNKGQMTVEQMRNTFDNAGSINSGDQSKKYPAHSSFIVSTK